MIHRRYYEVEMADGSVRAIPEEFMFEPVDKYIRRCTQPHRVNVFMKGEECHFDPEELVNG